MIRDSATGRDWGTAAEIAARLGPDVTDRMVINWRRRDGLTVHRVGRAVYSPLDQAAAIEAAKRRSTRGRRRQLAHATAA
ncbi:hypothetical protein [Micromonospora endolithica]|uniref:DNA-binding protein n=1 Tax=Micromonospora endolithica TaxID=230091 RepID=A0A3A9YR55_9ACTN|nr:hypothetical protein [Micromonospora endolithica]RKN38463.1 hypothetical protein D7223_31150 [Micromonospora endolithica]TWJ23115.1 hypothetical protein JD76_03244 [Micromonospora endolithica]